VILLLVCLAVISSSYGFSIRSARSTSSDDSDDSNVSKGSKSGNSSVIRVNPKALKNAPVQGRTLGLAIAVTTLLAALNVIPIATLTIAFYAVSYLMKGATSAYSPSWSQNTDEDSSSSLDYISKLLPHGASYDENLSGPFSLDIETDDCRMSAICEASGAVSSVLPSFVTSPINQAKGILSSYLGDSSSTLGAVISGVGRNCKPYSYKCSSGKKDGSSSSKSSKKNKSPKKKGRNPSNDSGNENSDDSGQKNDNDY